MVGFCLYISIVEATKKRRNMNDLKTNLRKDLVPVLVAGGIVILLIGLGVIR
jgi:hypothetical protein